ncbi:MAG TPA: hypothetical protein VN783_12875 [Thermoanaerobaculia bacterium]|nr:hypothetical protein [Thermoanaerobaculia bacterium]
MMPTLTPEILAAHRDLSLASRQFVEAAADHPEWLLPLDYRKNTVEPIPEILDDYSYPLQVWPTLIDGERVREIEAAIAGIAELVKLIPERIFGWDPAAIGRYYGIGDANEIAILFEPPNSLAHMAFRPDFFFSEEGLRFLETNFSPRLGGWNLRFWEATCRRNPAIAGFLQDHGLTPKYRDPLRALFAHLLRTALAAGFGREGEIHLAFIAPTPERSWRAGQGALFDRVLTEVRQELAPGLGGSIAFAAYPEDFEARRGCLYLGDGRRVDVVYEFSRPGKPQELGRIAKAGKFQLYNGPLSGLLTDKRNFALLSESLGTGRFDRREEGLIESLVPWSRNLIERPVEYRGERSGLRDLVLGRRERFVIKKGQSFEGRDVVVGKYTDEDSWRRAVDEAFAEGSWLAQEHVASRPYLYQAGERGTAVHEVVWGTFGFGTAYGGAFLRLAPRGSGDGVINSKRGASEGLVFEV